jgi:hypothetical protein
MTDYSTKGYRTCGVCHERSVAPDVAPAENLDGGLVLRCPDCDAELVVERVAFLKGKVE